MNPDFIEDEQELTYDTKITKKVVLQQRDDFQTTQQTTIKFYYQPNLRQIDFGKSMNQFFINEYSNLKCCQIFYYDTNTKYFTFLGIYPFEKEVFIKYEDFQDEVIHIKYHPIFQEDQEPEIKSKKPRVKQRTIKEVLKLVAEWRDIHSAKKVTLEVAAQEVGLPKKTLDDYYQQIKLAENYQFDFQSHLNQGIGILRKYVKEKHEKKKAVELNILKKYTQIVQKKKQEPNDSSQQQE